MVTDDGQKVKAKPGKGINDSILTNSGYKSNEEDNIKVYLRIRPPSKDICDIENDLCLERCSATSLTIATKPEAKQFSFDHVAGMDTTQEEVFATAGKGIIEAFVDGFNGTIFAYGQTGSGKTFTMLGPADDSNKFSHELRGLIPRSFEYAFSLINRQQEKAGDRVEFLAKCSFLEIYNEVVYDLLEPSSAGLTLRENIKKGVFVDGLAERQVASAKDAYGVLQSGWLNRRVASTSMNRESSRSHALFTVTLESKTKSGGVANIKEANLHLVDLAGSERQKDAKTADLRLKEAGSINKSLSALGNVIMALVDIAHGKNRYIHYRDSKLTFILRDSLGGNAKTYIIANVHPSSKCFGETLSTLNFARRAKMIKNKAVVNEDVMGNVKDLQAEIRKLKEMLAEAQTVSDTGMAQIVSDTATLEVVEQVKDDASHWQQMMLGAISERQSTEKEKLILLEKIEKLEELNVKKDKFMQSSRMILKFRNQALARAQRKLNKEIGLHDDESEKDQEIKLLKEEIKCLQTIVEHHPDVKKLNAENAELRSEIKHLKTRDPSNGYHENEIGEMHRYTMQLERQLKEMMNNKMANDTSSSVIPSLNTSDLEMENIRMEMAQLQAKLESTQLELHEDRKNFELTLNENRMKIEQYQKKEMELQCNLAAAEKSKKELQHTLESVQMKTAVERKTLNSIHMHTVKTLASPRNFITPRKVGSNRPLISSLSDASTPHRKQTPQTMNGIYSDANKSLKNRREELFEDMSSPPKLQKSSFDDSENSDGDKENSMSCVEDTRDEEAIYIEVLQEEMDQVQKLYTTAMEELSNEKKKVLPLNEKLIKAEVKAAELEEQLELERSCYTAKESELKNQLNVLQSEYATLCGNSSFLKGEAGDLKIMYHSLSKQLDEAKKQKADAHLEAGRKYASLESEYTSLQVEIHSLRSEMEQVSFSNNNLLSDYEQCKDELQFSQHKNTELKELITQEKDKNKLLQDSLEKLESMMDTGETSVAAVNEIRGQLHDLTKLNEAQDETIVHLKGDLEISKAEVAKQMALNLSDKEVISTFMRTVEDNNIKMNEKESVITSLRNEIEDMQKELEKNQVSRDEDQERVKKVHTKLKTELDLLKKEKEDKDKKCVSLVEEMDLACKKHAALITELKNDHQVQLQTIEGEKVEIDYILNEKIKQIKVLEENIAKLNNLKVSELSCDSVEKFFTCNENNFENLSETESWDTLGLEKPSNERRLTEKIKKCAIDKEVLESRISVLEIELEDSEKQLNEKTNLYASLVSSTNQLEREKAEKVFLLESALAEKEKLLSEKSSLQREVEKSQINLHNVQEDLQLNLEEMEKTKALEQKHFEEHNILQSKISVIEEERTRYMKQNEKLLKKIDMMEVEKTKMVAHKNTNQRIDHLVAVKKENNQLKEEIRTMKQNLTRCANCTQLTAKC